VHSSVAHTSEPIDIDAIDAIAMSSDDEENVDINLEQELGTFDGPLSVTKGDANTKPGANPRKAEAIWRGRAVRFSGQYDEGRTKT